MVRLGFLVLAATLVVRADAIDMGSAADAERYYARIGEMLRFDGRKPPPDLDALLEYTGYSDLKALDIERRSPGALMSLAGDDILAASFFAPKITDVAGIAHPVKYGWRKVVRLRVRPGSRASAAGAHALFLLFNFFDHRLDGSALSDRSAEVRHSVSNQAMLVSFERPDAYWFVFGPLDSGGRRINFLNAPFDARDPVIQGLGNYYVPVACAACHGGARPKLNFLDTDHWFDRTQDGEDFAAVGRAGMAVLLEGGNDPRSAIFTRAFATLYQLNSEIRRQNLVSDGPSTTHVRAVENWLRVHATQIDHLPPIRRPIPAANAGDAVWSESDPVDAALLPMLNRYCYRCHGPIRYNVFDKAQVLKRRDRMLALINSSAPDLSMPQDRLLDSDTKRTLTNLLIRMR